MKRLIAVPVIFILIIMLTSCALASQYQLHQPDLDGAAGYILTDGETVLLVDCGTNTDVDPSSDKLFAYLKDVGLRRIDYYIVTHYHNDHCYNLNQLLTDYGTDDTQVFSCSEELDEMLCPMARGVYNQMKVGDELQLGPYHVLCVGPEVLRQNGRINNDSLNFIITCGERRIFFGGDHVNGKVLQLHGDAIADCDILCFPHHGLRPYQMGTQAIRRVNPSVILIPGGPEGYMNYYLRSIAEVNATAYGIGAGTTVVLFGDGEEMDVRIHSENGAFKVQ